MFPKAIVSADVKPIELKHDIKPGEVNNDVKLYEMNDDVKPDARSIILEIDVCA